MLVVGFCPRGCVSPLNALVCSIVSLFNVLCLSPCLFVLRYYVINIIFKMIVKITFAITISHEISEVLNGLTFFKRRLRTEEFLQNLAIILVRENGWRFSLQQCSRVLRF